MYFPTLEKTAKSEESMVYKFGRLLQLAGLIILPIALAGSMSKQIEMNRFWYVAAIGAGAFALGWMLQETGKPK